MATRAERLRSGLDDVSERRGRSDGRAIGAVEMCAGLGRMVLNVGGCANVLVVAVKEDISAVVMEFGKVTQRDGLVCDKERVSHVRREAPQLQETRKAQECLYAPRGATLGAVRMRRQMGDQRVDRRRISLDADVVSHGVTQTVQDAIWSTFPSTVPLSCCCCCCCLVCCTDSRRCRAFVVFLPLFFSPALRRLPVGLTPKESCVQGFRRPFAAYEAKTARRDAECRGWTLPRERAGVLCVRR